MLYVAIVIYVLLVQGPRLVLKSQYKEWQNNFSWNIPILKLTPLLISFCIAFLMIYALTKTTKLTYIQNKDAIYGLSFNSAMKDIGFRDGMQVITLEGKNVVRISDIVAGILLHDGDVNIEVVKDATNQTIIIKQKDKLKMLSHPSKDFVSPIKSDQVKITEEKLGLSDAINGFGSIWQHSLLIINPTPVNYQQIGGFGTIHRGSTISHITMLLVQGLLILVILNLLPFPGFSMGNFIISSIETKRKKEYSIVLKNTSAVISIIIVVLCIYL
ncbi:hypothetical protein [Labilibacter marinus]|uniref:hypothetical protein n=1 Tax=Labilibacter marinus TaxID=1477105 RepID=UPI000835B0F6|nr:hypothetical protein [Labilibacter marinus]